VEPRPVLAGLAKIFPSGTSGGANSTVGSAPDPGQQRARQGLLLRITSMDDTLAIVRNRQGKNSKGCYTGQEIVARVQHKGKVKQRMFHITGKASNKKIDPGTAILCEDAKVGTVIESLEDNGQMHALGVIKNDASKKRLAVDGTEIKLY